MPTPDQAAPTEPQTMEDIVAQLLMQRSRLSLQKALATEGAMQTEAQMYAQGDAARQAERSRTSAATAYAGQRGIPSNPAEHYDSLNAGRESDPGFEGHRQLQGPPRAGETFRMSEARPNPQTGDKEFMQREYTAAELNAPMPYMQSPQQGPNDLMSYEPLPDIPSQPMPMDPRDFEGMDQGQAAQLIIDHLDRKRRATQGFWAPEMAQRY